MLAGVAGGLVGALVASGVYLATDDDPATVTSTRQVVVRPSSEVARRGDIASILGQDVPAVVAVVDDGGPDSGGAAGTGFVIDSDGVVVTNNHVVEGASEIRLVFSDGTERDAEVLGTDPRSDLAVLKVDASGLATVPLGDSDSVQVGDDVVAIGNALALEGGLSVTRGIISGLHREVETESGGVLPDLIQTDAAINPGNSGGPLVDAAGRVIGINTAIANPSFAENVGFAIPIAIAMPIVDQLAAGRQPASLGVSLEDGNDGGATVHSVDSGSPAARAGLRVGDVIVEVDGTEINRAATRSPPCDVTAPAT